MIITEKKPIGEVLTSLKGAKSVAILGCGRCATSCHTGGEDEVNVMAELLAQKGFKVPYRGVVEAQCDERLTRNALRDSPEVDAYVSMSCGSGASALASLTDKVVVPSNNTMFLGVIKRANQYVQMCMMCGDCMLAETAGVCVNARCGKRLLNGPCGGSKGGKCEADEKSDCAWAQIAERYRKRGRLNDIGKNRKATRVRK
jgi:hypothetical protein